jgi:transcriptional regulator with XRE-family HTH domain
MGQGAGKARSKLGLVIDDELRSRSLSHGDLAKLVRQAAKDEGQYSSTDEKQVRRWKTGESTPRADSLRWLASALGRPVAELTELLNSESPGQSERAPEVLEVTPEPADAQYVASIHDTNRHLIGLEVQHGGNDVLPLSLRYLSEIRRRLAVGQHAQAIDSELRAAAGELAGTAAWMAHDANDPELARQISYEALHYSRLAGDRAIELLTLSNLSFFDIFTRQPREALVIARNALQTPLTNYQQVIFFMREARALALLGDESGFAIAERAASDFMDGAASQTTEWWWLSKPEIDGHLAATYQDAGNFDRALPIWQEISAARPPKFNGNAWAGVRYLRLAQLLRVSLGAKDWATAEETISRVLPYVLEVRSGRVQFLLSHCVRAIPTEAPSSLREAGQQLESVLGRV